MSIINYRRSAINDEALRLAAERQRAAESDDLRLLSTQQVAKCLGKTVRTIERWRKERIGPKPIQIGTRFHYTRRGLKQWEDSGGAIGGW
jgi:predicted DNA-binding transcriptional regulator AlpA